jgi:formylglycine-generating enzyme required for sulfatase activity
MLSKSVITGAILLVYCCGLTGCGDDDSTKPVNNRPNAMITSPADGAHFTEGTNITFVGSAVDPQDGSLTGASLVWSSDHDGQLGTGATLITNALSRNIHIIKFKATDNDAKVDSMTITIDVDPAGYGDFEFIPRGRFTMGSPSSEPGRNSNEVQHQVTLSHGFWLLKSEVTQALWAAVMGGGPASQLPKTSISWSEAVAFCNTYSTQEGLDPVYTQVGATWQWDKNMDGYRLPTEAEWEYACRAGTETAFCNGAITNGGSDCHVEAALETVGWYCANSAGSIQDVMQKAPNAWGLYDMHGNAWEMCWDHSGQEPVPGYSTAAVTDPVFATTGDWIIIRSGNFSKYPHFCRSAHRNVLGAVHPGDFNFGFRVARTYFHEGP